MTTRGAIEAMDIVERLRESATYISDLHGAGEHGNIRHEAATEITRLRAEVAELNAKIAWYVDYANHKKVSICEEMGRTEAAKSRNASAAQVMKPLAEILAREVRDDEADHVKLPVKIGFLRAARAWMKEHTNAE